MAARPLFVTPPPPSASSRRLGGAQSPKGGARAAMRGGSSPPTPASRSTPAPAAPHPAAIITGADASQPLPASLPAPPHMFQHSGPPIDAYVQAHVPPHLRRAASARAVVNAGQPHGSVRTPASHSSVGRSPSRGASSRAQPARSPAVVAAPHTATPTTAPHLRATKTPSAVPVALGYAATPAPGHMFAQGAAPVAAQPVAHTRSHADAVSFAVPAGSSVARTVPAAAAQQAATGVGTARRVVLADATPASPQPRPASPRPSSTTTATAPHSANASETLERAAANALAHAQALSRAMASAQLAFQEASAQPQAVSPRAAASAPQAQTAHIAPAIEHTPSSNYTPALQPTSAAAPALSTNGITPSTMSTASRLTDALRLHASHAQHTSTPLTSKWAAAVPSHTGPAFQKASFPLYSSPGGTQRAVASPAHPSELRESSSGTEPGKVPRNATSVEPVSAPFQPLHAGAYHASTRLPQRLPPSRPEAAPFYTVPATAARPSDSASDARSTVRYGAASPTPDITTRIDLILAESRAMLRRTSRTDAYQPMDLPLGYAAPAVTTPFRDIRADANSRMSPLVSAPAPADVHTVTSTSELIPSSQDQETSASRRVSRSGEWVPYLQRARDLVDALQRSQREPDPSSLESQLLHRPAEHASTVPPASSQGIPPAHAVLAETVSDLQSAIGSAVTHMLEHTHPEADSPLRETQLLSTVNPIPKHTLSLANLARLPLSQWGSLADPASAPIIGSPFRAPTQVEPLQRGRLPFEVNAALYGLSHSLSKWSSNPLQHSALLGERAE